MITVTLELDENQAKRLVSHLLWMNEWQPAKRLVESMERAWPELEAASDVYARDYSLRAQIKALGGTPEIPTRANRIKPGQADG